MALYYYTTDSRLPEGITRKVFVPHLKTQFDPLYGEGWYLTDLPPETCERTLINYCWKKYSRNERIKNYLEVEVEGGNAVFKKEHVYFVPRKSITRFVVKNSGQRRNCSIKPCRPCKHKSEVTTIF